MRAPTTPDDNSRACEIRRGLGSRAPQRAWTEFLRLYSPVILQVVRLFESDADHAADCFLFVCEQLSRQRFRRLRQFRPGGPALFTTWLRAVVRNLCLDWRRQEFGRHRLFESIARLPKLEQDVFRCVYEQGMRTDEALLTLASRHPSLTGEHMEDALGRIRQSLNPRQLWLLSSGKPTVEPLDMGPDGLQRQVPDTSPSPESLAIRGRQREALHGALARLPARSRLLIRLRYEEELTLDQVARLAGFKDAQTADRKIREVLAELRLAVERGKPPGLSVYIE